MVSRATNSSLGTVSVGEQFRAHALSSQLPDEQIFALKQLRIVAPQGAKISMMILGVARLPREGSIHGTVITLITAAGTVTVDGQLLYFSEDVSPVFAEAGFNVGATGTRRHLLGVYDIIGLFSDITDVNNLPNGAQPPSIPTRFHSQFRILHRCMNPFGQDQCDQAGIEENHTVYLGAPSRINRYAPLEAEMWVEPTYAREEVTFSCVPRAIPWP